MSFFSKKRDELAAQGVDPSRVPPGQYVTDRFPVLHAGVVPDVNLADWDFVVDGHVAGEKKWPWDEFRAMPTETYTHDIHCVTKWSKLDTTWEGVPVKHIWDQIDVDGSATHVLVSASHGFTANLPVEDFLREGNLFAHTYEGGPLDPEHGYPLRLIVPHLYFWKSVKWVRGFSLMDADAPGFWGTKRVPHVRRPVRRATVLGRLRGELLRFASHREHTVLPPRPLDALALAHAQTADDGVPRLGRGDHVVDPCPPDGNVRIDRLPDLVGEL